MRAIILEDFDRDLTLGAAPEPEPAENEVLVRVHAASINGFDTFVALGMARGMMEYQFPVVPGRDFAGVVEKVGPAVGRFRPGDAVFGIVANKPALHDGAWAEYIAVPEDKLSPVPPGLDLTRAAALPLAGTEALMCVEAVDPKPGERVLIVGATGGVGNYAIQLAARRGATVIATGLPEDEAHLRDLGAAEVIDYSAGDTPARIRARHADGVHGLIDLVNRPETFAPYAELVAPGGRVASSLGAADLEQLAARGVTAANVVADVNAERLARLADLVASGKLRPPVERTLRLDAVEVKDALQVMASGRARGKNVISVTGG
jgi:NADPH:quinone reductase-like Zn-dependent oxidoreductase